MELSYHLKEQGPMDWRAMDEEALRYRAAMGDVIVKIDQHDFSARWGWIPLIDFGASLRHLMQELQIKGEPQTFEFTESDAWIRFTPAAKRMIVSASYSRGQAMIDIAEFSNAAQEFARKLRRDLLQRHPDLAHNPAFQALLPG